MAAEGEGPRPGVATARGGTGAAYVLIAPALLVLLVFFVVPVAAALLLSFTDFDIYALADLRNTRLVGLGNYSRLLRDPVFWKSLWNTLLFVVAGGPLTVGVALLAALAIQARGVRFKGLFRTAYFAPVVTTLVAVATVWRYLYHPRFGFLNYLLGLVGIAPIDWLGDSRWAMPAIILMAVWKNFGYDMVIFIAGLQNIPSQLYEAARIDGAGPFAQFRHVTVPMLSPTFLFIGVITTIGYFQLFAEPYVMTNQGGPVNATLSVALYMYKQGFKWWNLGYAAAVAFVLFLIILAASLLEFRLQRRGREA